VIVKQEGKDEQKSMFVDAKRWFLQRRKINYCGREEIHNDL